MTKIQRTAWLLLVTSLLGFAPGAARATPLAAVPGVVEQRQIVLSGVSFINLSPDGRWLTGLSPVSDNAHGRLCVYAVATLAERACADLAGRDAGLRVASLVWSPDSTRLAFDEDFIQFLRDSDLWIMDATTGRLTNLTDDGFRGRIPLSFFPNATPTTIPILVDVSPAWSPDGKTIAFVRTPVLGKTPGDSEIERIPATGGRPTPIVTIPKQAIGDTGDGLVWSPDAGHLYFEVTQGGDPVATDGVWSVVADGSDAHQLSASDPVSDFPIIIEVAATGDALLALSATAGPDNNRIPKYTLVDLATGHRRMLSLDLPGAPPSAFPYLATFSSDGTELLILTGGTDPDHQLVVQDLAGGAATPLGQPWPAAPRWPFYRGFSWASDGTVFIASANGPDTLLRIA